MIRPLVLAMLLGLCPGTCPGLTAEEMEGEWESVEGGHNTCAANPARLTVTRGPDHVTFDWDVPFPVYDGSTRSRVDYDLLEELPDALILRMEGETRRTGAGETVVWMMWPTADRTRFCWRRTDWPALRCEHAYRRCGDPAPTS